MEKEPGRHIKDGAFYFHLTNVADLEASPANKRRALRAIRLLVRNDKTDFYKNVLKENSGKIKSGIKGLAV